MGSGSAGTNNRETPVEEEHADKSRIAVCVRRSPAAHQILETISIELRLRLPHSIFPIIFSSGECVFLDISSHFANDVLKPFPLSCVQDAFTLEEFALILCPSWQFSRLFLPEASVASDHNIVTLTCLFFVSHSRQCANVCGRWTPGAPHLREQGNTCF